MRLHLGLTAIGNLGHVSLHQSFSCLFVVPEEPAVAQVEFVWMPLGHVILELLVIAKSQ